MLEKLAYLAQIMFVTATIAQAWKCHREGHANGLSHILIWKLVIGFTIMTIYTCVELGFEPVLLLGYAGQLSFFMVIVKYKYFPRNESIDRLASLMGVTRKKWWIFKEPNSFLKKRVLNIYTKRKQK